MENNKKHFKKSEANKWFSRNIENLESEQEDEIISLLSDWLKPFEDEFSNILEIGCGSGHRLFQISESFKINGYGIDPSPKAISYIKKTFPSLEVKVGFGDEVPFNKQFDIVHLGFFLYLVDRDLYLRCISEADRLTKPGGFISIIDFETPFPYSNAYSHKRGVLSHKLNNSDVFVGSTLYSVVNNYQFSHSNNFFDKDINERVSLTLLYKETDIFGSK